MAAAVKEKIGMSLRDLVMTTRGRYKDIEHQGGIFRVYEPDLKTRDKYMSHVDITNYKDGSTKVAGDVSRAQIELLVGCVYDAATDKPVFSDADVPALLDRPAGGILKQLTDVAEDFMNEASTVGKG
jgi:hypothetical protein